MDAYERALKLLAIREHSSREIHDKLISKGYGKNEVDDAISRLSDEHSLSDERYAASFIRSRLRRNPEGRMVLRMRLKEKGTPSDVADTALSDAWERGDYLKPLSLYYSTLVRRKGEEGARAVLLRKGFRESEIREAVSAAEREACEGECIDVE